MATILPSPSKTVVIGSNDFQSLMDGVKLIYLGSTKKEDTVNMVESNTETFSILTVTVTPLTDHFFDYNFQVWETRETINIVHWVCTVQHVK